MLDYVVQFRPLQRKKVASSIQWRFGKNVVLRLMGYLNPAFSFNMFMDNYFASFRLLAYLCFINIWVTDMLNKNRYTNALSLGTNSCKNRNVPILNSSHQTKKQRNFHSGWLEQQQCSLHRFCWIFRIWEICRKKLKETIFKNNNETNSTVTTKTWVLSKEEAKVAKYRTDVQMKNGGSPCLFEW